MSGATATQPREMNATEEFALESEGLDLSRLEDGVLPGVKLLGLRSRNRRDYDTPGVRESAGNLLEGASVYINHPDEPHRTRDYKDRFGVASAIEYRAGGGHYGTLRFNPGHPAANQFIWDVKNAPGNVGFSINARYRSGGRNAAGDDVVESLKAIRSVDLVTRPATTDGIFEHEVEEPEMKTLTAASLREDHPEIVEAIEADVRSALEGEDRTSALEAELAELKKKNEDLLEAERVRQEKIAIEAEFAEVVEGLEDDLVSDIYECACQMGKNRDKLKGVVERLNAPCDCEDGDDGTEAVDEEPPAPTPRRKKKGDDEPSLASILEG